MANEHYNNPVDGKTYIADEWKTYDPETPKDQRGFRVINKGIRLLNSQDDFSRNVDVEEFAKFIDELHAVVTKTVEGDPKGGEVLLQIQVAHDKRPSFQMSFQGDLSQEMLQKMYASLAQSQDYRTKIAHISFQLHLEIKAIKA